MHTQIEQTIDQLVVHLQNEGILDEQFHQLMQLQDETNPVSKPDVHDGLVLHAL